MKILLVEDDSLIGEPLVKALTEQHYAVDVAADGETGWALLESFAYDLILLDVGLPKLDGISLCRRLRSQGKQTPVLLLTAQSASLNKVIGLDAGADDYVAKPFNLQELLARVRALLRRGDTALPPLLEWRNLGLDPSICEVTCDRQLVRLTPKEYGLLELFLRNPHRIFSTGTLIDHIWSFEETPTEDTIRSHIKGLRQKLRAAGALDDPIETVYGLGYRLRPAEEKLREEKARSDKGQKRQDEGKTTIASQTLTGLSMVWNQVKEAVDRRVSVVEQAVVLLRQNKLSEELRQQAEQATHKLAGSLGMFGADQGSRLAQEIEPLFQKGRSLTRQQVQRLSKLVNSLRQELQHLNDLNNNLSSEPSGVAVVDQSVDERPWLLVVSSNSTFTAQLQNESSGWGFRVQIISNPVTAREQITKAHPDVALLDFANAADTDNHLMLLSELRACTPPVPVLVLTDQDRLIDRVKVTRLGGRRLQQPITATQVLEAVNQVLQQARPIQATVLVVDDDVQILTALQRLLIPWGLHVSVLDNPLLFLDSLEANPPDLLVLDIEMPCVSGLELCQVVRNDPCWSGLPILFLTAHTDAETMYQVFAVGADDFVSKPIVGPELVTRIFNRLERTRLLKSFAEMDALTGVANRRKSTEALSQFLQWCEHCQQPFCLALIELDPLKPINQQYGHAAVDQVLARFGELLRRSFHTEDIVGRWGGGEFIIGMAGMTQADGMQRILDLQQSWQRFEFEAESTSFQVGLRAEVVQYPQDGADLQMLYQTARDRLSQAEHGTRSEGSSP
ncbi:response regulator [Leptolyngbya ohadii]|uniref:response regulator n=1 Tax=Leptolyngbya ohadii TaxID=1962290 RepID=UPI000B59D7DD|nr:response regulator [Leptolyngbya ohadii]